MTTQTEPNTATTELPDGTLAHALAATFTPDQLDRLALHFAAAVEHPSQAAIASQLTTLLDAIGTGREMHDTILAAGAHAVGCHASALTHYEDCECWCHGASDADDYNYGEAKASALRALRWDAQP